MSGVSHCAALCFIAPSERAQRELETRQKVERRYENERVSCETPNSSLKHYGGPLPVGLECWDIKNEISIFNSCATRRSSFDGAVFAFTITDPAHVQVLLRHDHFATSGSLRTAILAVLMPVVRVLREERLIVVAPPGECFGSFSVVFVKRVCFWPNTIADDAQSSELLGWRENRLATIVALLPLV